MSSSCVDSLDLERALQSAVIAVRGAARLLRRHRHVPPPPRIKPDGSVVTDLDVRCEELVRALLRSRHPDHAIVGEECPFEPGPGGWVWYLDPLDGTRAYSAGQDNTCISATLTLNGIPRLTAVAAPFSGELYTAVRGRPSTVNGRAIRVAPPCPLREAEILLYYDRGEPGLSALYNASVSGQFGRLTVLPGSFILNACRAARGAYHVFLCVKRRGATLMPWDLAPAALVLSGAGGSFLDLEGSVLGGMIPAREVAAGVPATVAEVIALFGPRVRDPEPQLKWARRNEAVFARLCGMILGRGSSLAVGIGGAGGGIGKTTFARELATLLGDDDCRIVSLDDYLLPRLERDARGLGAHAPAANDLESAARDLALLRAGQRCTKPVYDHRIGAPSESESISPAPILIAEGVHALHPTIRSHLDLTIYLDAPPSVRYRRVARDVEEKGVTEAYAKSLHNRLEEEVRRHLMPLREAADVIIDVDSTFRLQWLRPE